MSDFHKYLNKVYNEMAISSKKIADINKKTDRLSAPVKEIVNTLETMVDRELQNEENHVIKAFEAKINLPPSYLHHAEKMQGEERTYFSRKITQELLSRYYKSDKSWISKKLNFEIIEGTNTLIVTARF